MHPTAYSVGETVQKQPRVLKVHLVQPQDLKGLTEIRGQQPFSHCSATSWNTGSTALLFHTDGEKERAVSTCMQVTLIQEPRTIRLYGTLQIFCCVCRCRFCRGWWSPEGSPRANTWMCSSWQQTNWPSVLRWVARGALLIFKNDGLSYVPERSWLWGSNPSSCGRTLKSNCFGWNLHAEPAKNKYED